MEADPTAPLILEVIKNDWSCRVCCIQTFETVSTADIGRQSNGYLATVYKCHHVNYKDNLSSKRTVRALCLEMHSFSFNHANVVTKKFVKISLYDHKCDSSNIFWVFYLLVLQQFQWLKKNKGFPEIFVTQDFSPPENWGHNMVEEVNVIRVSEIRFPAYRESNLWRSTRKNSTKFRSSLT